MRKVGGCLHGWMPVLLAIAANSWILGMPFQADDYLLLPRSGALLGIEDAAPGHDPRPDAQLGNFYLFRPVPWFLWWLLVRVGGGLADPALFHAVALLLHGLASLLLWRVLKPVFSPFAAVAGASLFAVAPGAVQATSYLAAAGDQLATVLMLAATIMLQRYRAAPRLAVAAGAGIGVALAFCSKEVAVASVPAAFLAAWAAPSPGRVRLWRPLAVVGLAVAAAVAVRALYLGTWKPAYLGAPSVGLSSVLRLDGLFLELIAPWRDCKGIEDLAPASARIAARIFRADPRTGLGIATAALFCLPILAGLLRSPRRVAARLAAIAVVLACALAPALVIYHPPSTHVVSRALYAAAAVAAAAVAAGVDPLGATKGGRWLAALLLVPLLACWADLMRHVARTELRAGAIVRARIASMDDLARSLPADARVLAVDDQFELGCIPLIYFGIGNAMGPPFRAPGLPPVTWWGDLETLPRGGILQEHPGPVVIARLSEGRYVERHPRVPALPAALPDLRRSPDDPAFWKFDAAVPARAVSGVRVAARSEGAFSCAWIGSRGKRQARGAFPGLGGEPGAIVSAPEDFEWLVDPLVLGVRLDGVTDASVEPLRTLPAIRIVAPPPGARIPVGVPDVAFELPPQPRSGEYRLTAEFAISEVERPLVIWEGGAAILREHPGRPGSVGFGSDWARARASAGSGPMSLDAFTARLDAALRASGGHAVSISLRVEGYDPRSGSVECRSAWRNCIIALDAR